MGADPAPRGARPAAVLAAYISARPGSPRLSRALAGRARAASSSPDDLPAGEEPRSTSNVAAAATGGAAIAAGASRIGAAAGAATPMRSRRSDGISVQQGQRMCVSRGRASLSMQLCSHAELFMIYVSMLRKGSDRQRAATLPPKAAARK